MTPFGALHTAISLAAMGAGVAGAAVQAKILRETPGAPRSAEGLST